MATAINHRCTFVNAPFIYSTKRRLCFPRHEESIHAGAQPPSEQCSVVSRRLQTDYPTILYMVTRKPAWRSRGDEAKVLTKDEARRIAIKRSAAAPRC
jgi:hypothetical protein